MSGHLKIVQYLVEIGKDKKIYIDAKDNDGSTALIWASRDGHPETVKYLLEKGADINAKNDNGSTALIIASSYAYLEHGYLKIVKYLLENDADINVKNCSNSTALIEASSIGHLEIVQCILAEVEKGKKVDAVLFIFVDYNLRRLNLLFGFGFYLLSFINK